MVMLMDEKWALADMQEVIALFTQAVGNRIFIDMQIIIVHCMLMIFAYQYCVDRCSDNVRQDLHNYISVHNV
jgi:hypothetical protein